MAKEVDARGLACPQPVILTKHALGKEKDLVILVDNPTSRDNVKRFAESQGCLVTVEQAGSDYKICITSSQEKADVPSVKIGTVFYITADSIGRGSEELGKILIPGFFEALTQEDRKPDKIIFTNSGVNLVCTGSPVLESLKVLAGKGGEVLACGTCLDYYNLKEKVQVGRVTNAYEILSSLMAAENVITV